MNTFTQQESTLTIAEVSQLTKLSADGLRYDEKADRTTGNPRRYASADVA